MSDVQRATQRVASDAGAGKQRSGTELACSAASILISGECQNRRTAAMGTWRLCRRGRRGSHSAVRMDGPHKPLMRRDCLGESPSYAICRLTSPAFYPTPSHTHLLQSHPSLSPQHASPLASPHLSPSPQPPPAAMPLTVRLMVRWRGGGTDWRSGRGEPSRRVRMGVAVELQVLLSNEQAMLALGNQQASDSGADGFGRRDSDTHVLIGRVCRYTRCSTHWGRSLTQ